jgi:transcriptional repressor NrdR
MQELRQVDGVAYVRFASVYRSFADLEALKKEVDTIIGNSH